MFRIMLNLGITVGLALGMQMAVAQDYPNRPIHFMQGFAPGGNADVITRVLGQALSNDLGQPVISESRSGAGGNLASAVTAKAPADGYTIVLLTTAHVISPAIYKSLAFDPANDFEFISTVSDFPFFIVTSANSPYKNIDDLVAAARANPGGLTVGTAGVGTGQHMCVELFATSTGIKVTHVPFRGDSAAVTALLGNVVDFIVAPGTAIFANIEAGKFKALAVSGSTRWPSLPQVPTVAETVAPGFEVMAWVGVATTRGVPEPIVERLNKELRHALDLPNVKEQLSGLGGIPRASSPAEMRARVNSEIKRWIDVATKAGIQKQ
jgi:tripartite-type tricarboxylate transporter receptor subunit TctC